MATNAIRLREHLGGFICVPVEFFALNTLTDGGFYSHGHADVTAFEAPFDGYVAGYSLTAAGNLTAAVHLIHVAGSATAYGFTVNGAATATGKFTPTNIPFVAGDAIAVELDSETTSDETALTLYLVYDLSTD